jgi:hypothetical protein
MSELEVSDFAPCIWHRNLRNLNAQLHEFTVNPRCAPKWILAAHCSNKMARFLRNARASRPTMTNLPSPIPSESLTVPADDGFRLDDQHSGTPTRPHARQPNPQASIAAIEGRSSWFLVSLQHGQLMAQCDDLGLHSSLAPETHQKGIEQH